MSLQQDRNVCSYIYTVIPPCIYLYAVLYAFIYMQLRRTDSSFIVIETMFIHMYMYMYSIRHKKGYMPVLTVTTEDVRDNPIMTLPSTTFKGPVGSSAYTCIVLHRAV